MTLNPKSNTIVFALASGLLLAAIVMPLWSVIDSAQGFVAPEDFEPPITYDNRNGTIISYQPKLSVWSVPAVMISNLEFTVFATVQDEFGDIQNGVLRYSVDDMPHNNITMQLIHGTPKNGTYAASIPPQQAGSTVKIELDFQDNLGYNAGYSHDPLVVTQDTEAPMIFCRIMPENPSNWQTVKVWCRINDYESGIAQAVATDPASDKTVLLKPVAVNESGGTFESDEFLAGAANTTRTFVVKVQDYAGNIRESAPLTYSVGNQEQRLQLGMVVSSIDISEMIVNEEFSADGAIQLQRGQEPTVRVPAQVDGQERQFILTVRTDPLAQQTSVRVPLSLKGESWLYPFDSYTANATLTIPDSAIEDVQSKVSYEEGVTNYWKASFEDETKIMTFGQQGSDTVHSIEVSFSRLPHVAGGIYLPVFGIFYLLGAIFVIKQHPNHLTNKLGISIGTFAFIFAFTEVIDSLKPSTGGVPTIADVALFSAGIATIGYSIGGVFETHYNKRHIDKLVFAVVSGIVAALFLQQKYPIEMAIPILAAIILGLGYGVLVRQIRYPTESKEFKPD